MANFFGKIREQLEWLHHGRLVVEVLLALGLGKSFGVWLKIMWNSPWVTPIWLLLSAGIMAMLVWASGRKKKVIQQATSAQIVATAAPASPIDVDEFFRTTYNSPHQLETEQNVRAMIQSRPEAERGEFIVKFLARGIVEYTYDRIWLGIFNSQFLALQELNRRIVMRREEIKSFYDVAAASNPRLYPDYSFDTWVGYLVSQVLIITHPGNTVEITLRGRDFLKYLVHYGYSTANRNN
jgi:hypothetical protein